MGEWLGDVCFLLVKYTGGFDIFAELYSVDIGCLIKYIFKNNYMLFP